LALAYRAGAGVADLEFCQFHPTALQLPGAPRFLISEAARGEGGILVDADGRRFMQDYDPRGELAPRHVVADAILETLDRSAAPCVYLDLSHLPTHQVTHRFPTIVAVCRRYGLDPTREPIPVAPAAHYMMGGVCTDLWGETDLPGLFACGEIACTGVHGANRLASNSLLEALVFGSRIVRRMVGGRAEAGAQSTALAHAEAGLHRAGGLDAALTTAIGEDRRYWSSAAEPSARPAQLPSIADEAAPAVRLNVEDLQALMWRGAGMKRSQQSLRHVEKQLALWASALPVPGRSHEHELHDMLLASRLVVAAAIARQETRGAHRRLDFPREDAAWRRRLVWRAPCALGHASPVAAAQPSLAGRAGT
jgi:L-aspartate oxidase